MLFIQNVPCSVPGTISDGYQLPTGVYPRCVYSYYCNSTRSCRNLIHDGKAAHRAYHTVRYTISPLTLVKSKHQNTPCHMVSHHVYACSEAWHLDMAPRQEPISLVARRSRAWAVARSVVLQAVAVAVAAQLLVVSVGSTAAVPVARAPLVFRVEGSRHDPDFSRACGVVKGLEDLYGKDRYTLHSVRQAPTCLLQL